MRKKPILLTPRAASQLLQGQKRVSLDLGINTEKVEIKRDRALLGEGEWVELTQLKEIAKDTNSVYLIEKGRAIKAAISAERYYRLVDTGEAPTLEVDGIRMHRTKGTTPLKDAELKASLVGPRGKRVLDTCLGLGYTALKALEKGAEYVVSLELSAAVLHLARLNPWTRMLWETPSHHTLLGDAYHILDALPPNHFTAIIHDPPRMSHAGHLYGADFYEKLARVAAPRCQLYHYTGEPGSRYRRINIRRGVAQRLGEAGFTQVRYHPTALGLTCTKQHK